MLIKQNSFYKEMANKNFGSTEGLPEIEKFNFTIQFWGMSGAEKAIEGDRVNVSKLLQEANCDIDFLASMIIYCAQKGKPIQGVVTNFVGRMVKAYKEAKKFADEGYDLFYDSTD